MTRGRSFTTLVTLTTALLVWYGVSAYPLGQKHVDVIGLEGAPQKIITLNAGDTISQSFHTLQPLLSSVSVYSANDRLTDQKIILSVSDPRGRPLARSSLARSSYRDEKLKLTFPIDWLETNIGQRFNLDIKLEAGSPLQFIALTEDPYKKGALALNNKLVDDLDFILSTTQPVPTASSTKKGVIAGLIFLFGTLFLQLISPGRRRWRWFSAGLLLIIITPLALGGFWQSRHLLGINDWDYYFSLHHYYRQTILQYHQLPLWNPYTCGGTAGLADPEFPLFTPTFLLELIFGVPVGLRLAIFFSAALGTLGMLLLGKRISLSVNSCLLVALIAFFGTINLLEIVEGHPNIFAAMWIPWIFWAWLGAYTRSVQNSATRSIRSPRGLLCGVFLALAFYQGGIYLLMYTALAFILLPFLVSRPRAAIIVTVKATLWALGLAAIKLVPSLLWLKQFPDDAYASSAATLPYLYEIFLGRHLHGAGVLPGQNIGWHEYGAYVGPLVVALALLGLTNIRRSRLVRALAVSAVLAILLSSAGPVLKPAFDLMPFLPRSSISRFILFAVIPLALLAGIGLDNLTKWRVAPRPGGATGLATAIAILLVLLPGLVAVDLFTLAYPLSEQSFVLPEVFPSVSPAPKPVAFTALRYDMAGQGSRTTRAYAAARAGYGTFVYCSVLGPRPAARTIHDEEDNEIISLSDKSASYQLNYWSPNEVIVDITTQSPVQVTLNTNYAAGWTANGRMAVNREDRVSIDAAHSGSVTFRYQAPGFVPGLVITAITVIIAAIYLSIDYTTFARQSTSKSFFGDPLYPADVLPKDA